MPIPNLSKTSCKFRHLPVCQSYRSENDAFVVTNVISDMLRQKESPAKSQRKVVRRISCDIEGVYAIGLCISRFFSEKNLFHVNREDWDQTTPSNSPKAPGTKVKFGKGRVYREELSKSVRTMSVVVAPKFEERSHEETLHPEGCARKAAWDLAKNIHQLKNCDKATCYAPIDAGAYFEKFREAKIRSRFRSINAHVEQKRIELR